MKVLCISWRGDFFTAGDVYSINDFDCVYNPRNNYTSAGPWFMYRDNGANFILATDLIIALN